MTHREILEQTKSELDRLVFEAKRKLDDLVKPELEVGKWYKGAVDFESLIYITEVENVGEHNNIHGYGFKGGGWNSLGHLLSNTDHEKSLVEATDQEVEEALAKEAKRRGYMEGVSVIDLDHGKGFLLQKGGGYLLSSASNKLFAHGATVFKDGIWATIIEKPVDKFAELKEANRNGAIIEYFNNITNKWTVIQGAPHWLNNIEYRIKPKDKFAELKEAHKNGAVIQLKSWVDGEWYDVEDKTDLWLPNYEYRIKPEEKPKVGDVCKFWNNDETEFVVGVLARFDLSTYGYSTTNKIWYKNAKKLTKQQAIELLFGKDGNND